MKSKFFIFVLIAINLMLSPATAGKNQPIYFPDKIFSDKSNVNALINQWFGEQLLALEELPLYPAETGIEVYRFTWLRSFHKAMSFRLTITPAGTGQLSVTRTNGAGGYDPGSIDLKKNVEIQNSDVEALRNGLKDMGFWLMPAKEETRGMDGAEWLLESVSGGLYHLVVRWSPQDGKFRDWAMSLMILGNVELGEIY